MKAVTRFVAIDGTEFFDEYGCREYEHVCQEISDLTAAWPEEKITGDGFIQQDKNVVLRVQRGMVDIFERRHWKDRHTEWARNADVPAAMTLIGRYVDDAGCKPERVVWGRIARLDRRFREYEQPYYAIQADDADPGDESTASTANASGRTAPCRHVIAWAITAWPTPHRNREGEHE
jgi:hypothetical protein